MNNSKTDRRVKFTIILLKDALIKSLQEKHISKISVKSLCEIADINRSTFYSHFQDQYDLLRYVNKEVINNIMKHLEGQDYNEINPISFQNLNRILDYVKENANLFHALLSDNCVPDFQREFMKITISYQIYDGIDERTKDYLSVFGLTGCISILQKWLNDGMPESTTEITEIILQVINKGLTSFTKTAR